MYSVTDCSTDRNEEARSNSEKGIGFVSELTIYCCSGCIRGGSRYPPTLNLRYCEIAIRDIAKISAKKSTYPLKAKLDQCTHDSKLWNEKHVSPIGLAVSQASEMKRLTGIDMQFVQPEPEFSEGAFRRCLERPSYWSQLGS